MIRRILVYLKPLWFRFIVALLCMAGVAGISTGLMWLLKFLIDSGLNQKDPAALNAGVVLILVAISLKSMLWYSHNYLTSYVAQSISRQIRDNVFRHLTTLSMGFFNEKASSGLMARLTNDVSLMQTALMAAPTTIIRDGLTVMGLLGFIFYQHWKFASLCFLVLPIAAVLLTYLGKKSRKAGREGQARMADMYGLIQESLTAMPIVKTFQNEQREIDDFKAENRRYFDVMMKLVRVEARSSPMMEVLGSIVLAVMIFIGGHDVLAGRWTVGAFISFVGAAMSLHNPLKSFANTNVKIQQGLAAAERVFQILDQQPTVLEKPQAKAVLRLTTAIEFQHIDFSYPATPFVLRDINLVLKKGTVTALVGASGSGKSTIAQLLLRFYDPDKGAILYDGIDLRDISISSLRSHMAVVTQETHLFNDTIYKNIEYGKPGASEQEVYAAAQAAYADDFIRALPQGYATMAGERGTRLSGGERQRLAIARALLKNPDILILDEATSALDITSEKIVQKALDRLLEGRTVLVIAHSWEPFVKLIKLR
jgi:ATP-binding cassette, subfamily B, bacterial MsbA